MTMGIQTATTITKIINWIRNKCVMAREKGVWQWRVNAKKKFGPTHTHATTKITTMQSEIRLTKWYLQLWANEIMWIVC